jgi:bifunctional non-homologous end joining protein LigD
MGDGRDKPGLDEYRRKRDPGRTTEPFSPGRRSSTGATRHGEFVVHLHAATRRHHDLRLQVGDGLASFAVPKGPSLRPSDKRLAVQTEAHPLEYLDFEQVIPEGNYGAGAMIVWDRGRVRYLETTAEQGLEKGKLDFELHGHKLRGRFALVRTSDRGGAQQDKDKPQWLLLKKTDAFSSNERDLVQQQPASVLSGLTVEELPRRHELADHLQRRAAELGGTEGRVASRRVTPMLCQADGNAPLEADDWLYELKLDGVRILAERDGDEVTLSYRTRRAATASYPEIAEALRSMIPVRFVLDGEIVAFDETGRPSFQRLGRRIHASRPMDVRFAARAVPVVYVVFDLLELGGRDLRGLPLRDRKALLAELVRGPGLVRTLDFAEQDGTPLYELCLAQHLEGLVAKRMDSVYRSSTRSADWIKIKVERDDEFVVVGYTRGQRSRSRLGALDLASYENGRLVLRGKVGSGLDETSIETLLERLQPLERNDCAAEGELERAPRGRRFVEPELVASVRFSGWSEDGRLRHPVFRGIREDKRPEQCTAAPPPDDDALLAAASQAHGQGATRTAGQRGVQLTNQNKVFWPREGYTKGDLCDYYEAVAPTLLPYLADRPVVLVRYPDGIEGKSFYQWNLPEGTPAWVRTTRLQWEERENKRPQHTEVEAFVVDDVDTLLHIANLGAIPIHVLAARAESLDECDFLTVDFDVGESRTQDAIPLARSLGEILERIGLPGYPKTSGRSGLHVLAPLGPGVSFETARTLGELLGRLLVGRHPEQATMERLKRKRGDRVYVDTGQIGRSRTIVAPWSVRAHPGATVSTPLEWDEVGFALDPRRFTIHTVPERIADRGDPMRPMLDQEPDIEAAVAHLGELLGQ